MLEEWGGIENTVDFDIQKERLREGKNQRKEKKTKRIREWKKGEGAATIAVELIA